MQFVVTAHDGANMLAKRLEIRPKHFENISRLRDHVLCAGGILDDEGQMIGSVLVMEFDDRAGVDEYLRTEPYVVSGVWERIEVEPMNVVVLDKKLVGK